MEANNYLKLAQALYNEANTLREFGCSDEELTKRIVGINKLIVATKLNEANLITSEISNSSLADVLEDIADDCVENAYNKRENDFIDQLRKLAKELGKERFIAVCNQIAGKKNWG